MENILWLLGLIAIFLLLGSAGYAALRAAPWLPTRSRDINRLLSLAAIKPGETVVDLGCGDGRLVLAAAERCGARAVGIEVSLIPYCIAKVRARFSKARARVSIRLADFYAVSLRDADVVVCFLTPDAMARLKTKCVQELKPGARLLSYAFSLRGWEGSRKDKPSEKDIPIYLYQQGVGNSGIDAK